MALTISGWIISLVVVSLFFVAFYYFVRYALVKRESSFCYAFVRHIGIPLAPPGKTSSGGSLVGKPLQVGLAEPLVATEVAEPLATEVATGV